MLVSRGGFYKVFSDGQILTARLRGKLKRAQKNENGLVHNQVCVAGDQVTLLGSYDDDSNWTIESISPRKSTFSRASTPGVRAHGFDLIAANIEVLFIVFAHSMPPPKPRLIDRFLVAGEHSGLELALIANKNDLACEESRSVFDAYRVLGYDVIDLSTKDASSPNLARIKALQTGRICAFTGPSGVGKSSLIKTLDPTLDIRVGEVSNASKKGTHTTRATRLYPFNDGFLVDTPGLRELSPAYIKKENLAALFVEFREYDCTFRNCAHVGEKGCAIREAVTKGQISEARHDSYLRLRDELVLDG